MLKELIQHLPVASRLTLFGSAPLQLTVDAAFLSEDLDCFAAPGDSRLKDVVEQEGFGKESRQPYIQVCDELNFSGLPNWMSRAISVPVDGRIVVIPHPIDILVGKLHRMADKDVDAFKMVREKTGHPTEDEMLHVLQNAVDLYRPGFDEEKRGDLKVTTRVLWLEVFGRDIDVASEIIAPAQKRKRRMYLEDSPTTDLKASLENLKKMYLPPKRRGPNV